MGLNAQNIAAQGQQIIPDGEDQGYESFPDEGSDDSEQVVTESDGETAPAPMGPFPLASSEYGDSMARSDISESQILIDNQDNQQGINNAQDNQQGINNAQHNQNIDSAQIFEHEWAQVSDIMNNNDDKAGPSSQHNNKNNFDLLQWVLKSSDITEKCSVSPDVILIDEPDSTGVLAQGEIAQICTRDDSSQAAVSHHLQIVSNEPHQDANMQITGIVNVPSPELHTNN